MSRRHRLPETRVEQFDLMIDNPRAFVAYWVYPELFQDPGGDGRLASNGGRPTPPTTEHDVTPRALASLTWRGWAVLLTGGTAFWLFVLWMAIR